MNIRRAELKDIEAIINLLKQVNRIHHEGRPDIFKLATKYTPTQLAEIIHDDTRPILVAEDTSVRGYAFCVIESHPNDNMLTDVKTLYLDDLCVDEACRGKHVGTALYEAVLSLAKERGCHNVTLNVWSFNQGALAFYKKCGMQPLKTCMEQVLD